MPVLFNFSLCLFLGLISCNASGQYLFGNPSCSDWKNHSVGEKTTWLNAYLVPLNMTNVARKKPKVNKFSLLTSLDSVVLYVDGYCAENMDSAAAMGASRFLNELTSDTQNN